jgi:predicted transposase YbfD/YdcC
MLRWKQGERPACDHAQDHFKGHGRIEHRMLLAWPVTDQQVNWPHAAQAILLRRQRQVGQQAATEDYHCAITSCSCSAAELLEAIRGHWGIENRLFHIRDVTLGEDASRVRSGDAPQVVAALRNAVLALLHHAGWSNKARALRRYAACYDEALALLIDSS